MTSRRRNTQTGVTISVSDEKAARLGREWEQVAKPAPTKAPAKKAASSRANKAEK